MVIGVDWRQLGRLGVFSALALPLALVSYTESAHGQTPADSQWIPPSSSVAIGLQSFVGDGESSRRLGMAWNSSETRRFMVTTRFWDHYDVIEGEVRWLRSSRSSFRPFFAVSGVWQNVAERRGIGGAVGGGLEHYPMRWMVVSLALAWQSLFNDAPYDDKHWFRLNVGVSLVPFG